ASAVAPAKPAMTLPLPMRRTLRAFPFITVWPRLTWPSPAITTFPPFRTVTIVVACMELFSLIDQILDAVRRLFVNLCKLRLPDCKLRRRLRKRAGVYCSHVLKGGRLTVKE